MPDLIALDQHYQKVERDEGRGRGGGRGGKGGEGEVERESERGREEGNAMGVGEDLTMEGLFLDASFERPLPPVHMVSELLNTHTQIHAHACVRTHKLTLGYKIHRQGPKNLYG